MPKAVICALRELGVIKKNLRTCSNVAPVKTAMFVKYPETVIWMFLHSFLRLLFAPKDITVCKGLRKQRTLNLNVHLVCSVALAQNPLTTSKKKGNGLHVARK